MSRKYFYDKFIFITVKKHLLPLPVAVAVADIIVLFLSKLFLTNGSFCASIIEDSEVLLTQMFSGVWPSGSSGFCALKPDNDPEQASDERWKAKSRFCFENDKKLREWLNGSKSNNQNNKIHWNLTLFVNCFDLHQCCSLDSWILIQSDIWVAFTYTMLTSSV